MKAEELKGKSTDELTKMLVEMRKEQFNLRFQQSGGQLENTAQMRKVRRDIARVKTMLTQQQKEAA
ncbi:MAG: 50S ribosomal protein L29 [Alphaproteobacteria bacterium]|nr:50S ribosomal protein L29 [Alphaproteobacteria bacterium]